MKRDRHNAGFSLVEVIVAVAILSIALVGLTHGITAALSSNKESELQTTAAMFAAGLIENMRAEGGIVDGETEGTCGDELPLYSWTESISSAGMDGLHEVDVTVQSTRTGAAIYELRTMLFEPPEQPTDNNSRNGSDSRTRRSRTP